jgi:hypothetical protein
MQLDSNRSGRQAEDRVFGVLILKPALFLLLGGMALTARDSTQSLPTADEIVARMMERENQLQATSYVYSGFRRYVLENQPRHNRAEILVRMNCLADRSKEFETISASGWSGARRYVFPRLLESEKEASLPRNRERSRITADNYWFEMVGKDTVKGRAAYLLAITPKTENKYLIRGKIWVDADEYAIICIEGEPAKAPSFWIKNIHFVHRYEKNGPLWLPASDRSVTNVRIFGATEVTIDYFSYALKMPMLSRAQNDAN